MVPLCLLFEEVDYRTLLLRLLDAMRMMPVRFALEHLDVSASSLEARNENLAVPGRRNDCVRSPI